MDDKLNNQIAALRVGASLAVRSSKMAEGPQTKITPGGSVFCAMTPKGWCDHNVVLTLRDGRKFRAGFKGMADNPPTLDFVLRTFVQNPGCFQQLP